MRYLRKEVFRVLYVNSQNQIIGAEDLFEGTADSSAVWAREVVAAAIRQNATGLIFVHNHPSGSPEPSQSDREVTRDLVYAARIMQIKALDHVIIGEDRYFSFAGEGLIERYETDFLTLRMKGTADQNSGNTGRRGDARPHDVAGHGLPWSSPV